MLSFATGLADAFTAGFFTGSTLGLAGLTGLATTLVLASTGLDTAFLLAAGVGLALATGFVGLTAFFTALTDLTAVFAVLAATLDAGLTFTAVLAAGLATALTVVLVFLLLSQCLSSGKQPRDGPGPFPGQTAIGQSDPSCCQTPWFVCRPASFNRSRLHTAFFLLFASRFDFPGILVGARL
ncbi:hypothetical protein LP414_20565 [Polaromonas sp. P1(28)-13]|nr:hypothetical protein LP414_20565 [Polaromonas sp. P1(28)-13]